MTTMSQWIRDSLTTTIHVFAWMEKYAQQTPPTRKLSAIGSYPIPLRGTDQIVEVSKLDPEIVFSP